MKHEPITVGLVKWHFKCFYDSLVLLMNICAENPPLRKARKRCAEGLR